jgi:hypothetical protein
MGIETQELKNKVVKNQGPKMCLTLKKKNKDLISSKMLSWSSKLMSFLSLQRYYKRQQRHYFSNNTSSGAGNPPTIIQVNDSSRHFEGILLVAIRPKSYF